MFDCSPVDLMFTRVLHKIWRFMIILWDSSISKTVFGGPLWGSWGGWNPLGEPPEGVIFKVLLLIIRIPYFFEIWAKICQNLTKKKFQNFYFINDQMSLKFEANFANKIFLGVNLLLFDKIMLKFQISWKSNHFWPKFTNKKPFLLSKKFLKFFLSNRMPKVVICTMPFPEKITGPEFHFII